MRPIVTDRVAWSVGLSVAVVNPAKTAEPIKMRFELRTRVGPTNHVLDGGPDPPVGSGNFDGGMGWSIIKYRDRVSRSVQPLLQGSLLRHTDRPRQITLLGR